VASGEPERQPGAVAWFSLLGGATATFLVAVLRDSLATVRSHVAGVLRKLGLPDRDALRKLDDG
jgi:hypothetical protein